MRPVLYVVIVLAILAFLVSAYARLQTDFWWFDSVGYGDVHVRRLLTQIVMFALFGGVTALVVAGVLWFASRLPTLPAAAESPGRIRSKWLGLSARARLGIYVLVAFAAGIRAGLAAADRWQLWLLWRNAVPFGQKDPRFGRDYSYYVFVEPFHHYVVGAVISALLTALLVALLLAWLQGSLRLRRRRLRTTVDARVLLSVLGGLLLLAKAAAYWLDRLSTVVSDRGPVTGQSYTDLHVVVQADFGLMILALVLGVLLLANAWFANLRVLVAGAVGMIAAAWLLGGVLPAVVQTLVVKPSAVAKESTSIGRNIDATRFGYGIDGTTEDSTGDASTAKHGPSVHSVVDGVEPRLLDPNVVSKAFNRQEERESYYGFAPTADVDRYTLGGQTVDEDVSVRELELSDLASAQHTWTNSHLVYTHGYGVVAASTGQVTPEGAPVYDEQDIPATGNLGAGADARIYYGESSPRFSIVGSPTDTGAEADRPEQPSNYTNPDSGGVGIGTTWRRLLYAIDFRDKNIFFSSGVNPASRLLYLRQPAERIREIAPWLTVDGDVYPVVTDSGVTWVADGYTTSDMLPDSERYSLRELTDTTYNEDGSEHEHGREAINYIRNDVVATVDATTGAVSLYLKPGTTADPVLQAWMHAFPGLVQPAASFPADLTPHLRYPQDLFNVQREVLAKYHVTNPTTFYAGTQFWTVPDDPAVRGDVVPQPSYYATTGSGASRHFTLRSPLLTLDGAHVAAELSVDCDPGPDYGRLVLSALSSTAQTKSPSQLQNDIDSDIDISQQLSLEDAGSSQVLVGNLQTLLIDGQQLSIEPIYTQASTGQPYPLLKHVVVRYGVGPIGFQKTFVASLAEALGAGPRDVASVADELQRTYDALLADQRAGDSTAVARDTRKLGQLIEELTSAGASAGSG